MGRMTVALWAGHATYDSKQLGLEAGDQQETARWHGCNVRVLF